MLENAGRVVNTGVDTEAQASSPAENTAHQTPTMRHKGIFYGNAD